MATITSVEKSGSTEERVHAKIEIQNFGFTTQDIKTWKTAIQSARHATNPRRKLLYALYEQIALDGQVVTVMNKRRVGITNKKILFRDGGKGGEVNEVIRDTVLETPWFFELLEMFVDTRAYGHSLTELIPVNGEIGNVELISRANVVPERNFMAWSVNDLEVGIDFTNDPMYAKYFVPIGRAKDYGYLMSVAQYVIYKRGGFGDWAQFAEIFGMPFRWGEYDAHDETARTKLMEGLGEMGGAGYATIPKNTSLHFADNNASGKSDVFKHLVEMCDAQIAKIVLGQTMTTEDGSSKSQSETHKEEQNDITLSDMRQTELFLNWVLKPKLADLGYPVNDGGFAFPETMALPLDKQIIVDQIVAKQVHVPDEYWYETYGIPKPDGKAKPTVGPGKKPKEEDTDTNNAVLALYSQEACGHDLDELPVAAASEGADHWERVIKKIHKGALKTGVVDAALWEWVTRELFKGVTKGFGKGFADLYPKEPDFIMLANLEANTQVFAAFKTEKLLRAANNLLVDENNKIRTFSQFKQAVASIGDAHLKRYLKTEYNQAIANGQQASRWVDIQANKDVLPFLRYVTAGDDRVRPTHQALSGITKPVGDKFWDTYYPPNGWGDRCTVQQVRRPKLFKKKPAKLPQLPGMFSVNLAKKGVVFPANHPYFKVQQGDKAKAKNNWSMPVKNRNDEE